MPYVPVVAIVGTTASGKSELAVTVAELLDGEVVNADSMQLYKGLNLGAAKITREEMRGVPHHLLDVLDLDQPADVASFQRMAREIIDQVLAVGRTPVLVGGSGLYVRAVLDDVNFPPSSPELRSQLQAELQRLGPVRMHSRLAAVDPDTAARIDPGNGRRVVRALEILTLTGQAPAAAMPNDCYVYNAVQVGLSVRRDVLHRRITDRLDAMWRSGLVDEVRRLDSAGLRDNPTARQALGYAQILRYLGGECTEEEARHETLRKTKRFARGQETWLRRDPRINWLEHDRPDLAAAALAIVQRHVSATSGAQ